MMTPTTLYPKGFRIIAMVTMILAAGFVAITMASDAKASGIFLRMGPSTIGTGGSNPLGIPPGASDLEGSFISNNKWEYSVGLPGLLMGKRLESKWGGYVTLGGGLILDANGAGPGAFSAFGVDFGWGFPAFNLEYKQALGLSSAGMITPYAVRFGIGIWMK